MDAPSTPNAPTAPRPLEHVCDSGLLGPEDCGACRAEARQRQLAAAGIVGINGSTPASVVARRLPLPPVMTGLPVTESESDDALSEHSTTRAASASSIGQLGITSPNNQRGGYASNSGHLQLTPTSSTSQQGVVVGRGADMLFPMPADASSVASILTSSTALTAAALGGNHGGDGNPLVLSGGSGHPNAAGIAAFLNGSSSAQPGDDDADDNPMLMSSTSSFFERGGRTTPTSRGVMSGGSHNSVIAAALGSDQSYYPTVGNTSGHVHNVTSPSSHHVTKPMTPTINTSGLAGSGIGGAGGINSPPHSEAAGLTSSNSVVTVSSVPHSTTTPPTPTAVCWWPEPPLVTDFRRNAKLLTMCYSICSYVVSSRRLCGAIAFSTAMYFINRFVYCHGQDVSGRWGAVSRIDPATLSAAAVFLATKAENFKVKLGTIVEYVFECPSTDTDRHNAYKLMTLQVEVMLISTLSGSMTIIHPFATISALAPETGVVGQKANKLYSYTIMTPLALYFDHQQIAMALIAIVTENITEAIGGATDVAKAFAEKLRRLLPEAKVATELALIEALVVKGKGCGLPKLDAVVEQRLKGKQKNSRKTSVQQQQQGQQQGGAGGVVVQSTPPGTPIPQL